MSDEPAWTQIFFDVADSSAAMDLLDRLEEVFERCGAVSHSSSALIEDGPWTVSALFTEAISDHQRQPMVDAAEATGIAIDDVRVEALPDRDWVAYSLRGLTPVLSGRWLIHGVHDRPAVKVWHRAFEIEAAQAFGTGHHETTRGCLTMLDKLAKHLRFDGIYDLGTGTGVLALAAADRFRVPVLATDIDPLSVAAALDNARKNGLHPFIRVYQSNGVQPLLKGCQAFDLVMANILARPLMAMAQDISGIVRRSGHVILSGLMRRDERRIVARYRVAGFALSDKLYDGDWVTLVMRKK